MEGGPRPEVTKRADSVERGAALAPMWALKGKGSGPFVACCGGFLWAPALPECGL